jgi:transposase InsO family protein
MREAKLRALHGYRTRRWSVGKPAMLVPNRLERQFTVTRRNKVWVTDITYIRTWQGWVYLAVVMDLFSRKIAGWAAGPTVAGELVLNANRSGASGSARTPRCSAGACRSTARRDASSVSCPHRSPTAGRNGSGFRYAWRRCGNREQQPESSRDGQKQQDQPQNGAGRRRRCR